MVSVSEHICGHCGSKNIKPIDEECPECSSTLAEDRICEVCQNRTLWYNPDSNPRDVVIGKRATEMNRGQQPEVPKVTHQDNENTVVWCGICNKVF